MENHVHSFYDHGNVSDHFVDGHLSSIGIKGLFGSKAYFDHEGHYLGRTEPNVFGGKSTFHDGNLVDYTVPFKNVVLHPMHTELTSSVIKGLDGHDIHHADGSSTHVANLSDGFTSVMNFTDPLLHIAAYKIPPILFK